MPNPEPPPTRQARIKTGRSREGWKISPRGFRMNWLFWLGQKEVKVGLETGGEKRAALKLLREEKGRQKKKDVKITMPGRVVQVLAASGDEVKEGQPILVLEAMKMQNEIKTPQAGQLTRILFRAGGYVEAGA